VRITKSAGLIAALAGAWIVSTPVNAAQFTAASQGLTLAAKQLSAIVDVQITPGAPPGPPPSAAQPNQRSNQNNNRRNHERRGHHGGGNAGAAAAAGIIGLGLGAIIATESQRQHQQAVEECARRYPSYDPESETFIGRNGMEYQCP
jgi:hypothetical protein